MPSVEIILSEKQDVQFLTFKKSAVSKEIALDWDLYGLDNEDTSYYQIFTYSHPIDDYRNFAKEIKDESN